jgi:release factor glutamine methyltransferase
LTKFSALFRRRAAHEPIQYLLGETEFMGMVIEVDGRVLIPRPETEILVERTLEVLEADQYRGGAEVLEIGTGSGCIAIALGARARQARITAVDVSEGALRVAAQNIARHGLQNIGLLRMDVLAESPAQGAFDVLVANPPYVSAEDFADLQEEIRDFEPREATTDGGDGFTFHQRILELACQALRPGGSLLLEVGFSQSTRVRTIAEQLGLREVSLFRDYAGIERVVRARRVA